MGRLTRSTKTPYPTQLDDFDVDSPWPMLELTVGLVAYSPVGTVNRMPTNYYVAGEGMRVKIDDSRFIGALFVPYGILQIATGIAAASAIGARADLGLALIILFGTLTTGAGIAAFRKLWWAKYALGVAALFIATGFPVGTVLSAVAFFAIGRNSAVPQVSCSEDAEPGQ